LEICLYFAAYIKRGEFLLHFNSTFSSCPRAMFTLTMDVYINQLNSQSKKKGQEGEKRERYHRGIEE